MRGSHTANRDSGVYTPFNYSQSQQQQQPTQGYSPQQYQQPQSGAAPVEPSVNGQTPPQVRVPERPMSSRPAQPQTGDELDIPPFLYPKFKNR